jgi:hypothetical protein
MGVTVAWQVSEIVLAERINCKGFRKVHNPPKVPRKAMVPEISVAVWRVNLSICRNVGELPR